MNSKELAVYSMAIDKLLEHGLIEDAREVLQYAISQAPPISQTLPQNDKKNSNRQNSDK